MNKEAKILIGLTIATILVLVGGASLFSKKQNTQTQEAVKVYDSKLLIGNHTYPLGNENAKVTIVEFGDYQCPACGASYPITKEVLKEYGDKIRFVFRNFPLEQHANAFPAARAAEAAGAQGKFWEMHDKLYETQDSWGTKPDAPSQFEGFAKDLGLDVEKFKKDIADKVYDSNIQEGLTDGTAVGINATPTFFVNGVKQSGILTLNEWKTVLADYLK